MTADARVVGPDHSTANQPRAKSGEKSCTTVEGTREACITVGFGAWMGWPFCCDDGKIVSKRPRPGWQKVGRKPIGGGPAGETRLGPQLPRRRAESDGG